MNVYECGAAMLVGSSRVLSFVGPRAQRDPWVRWARISAWLDDLCQLVADVGQLSARPGRPTRFEEDACAFVVGAGAQILYVGAGELVGGLPGARLLRGWLPVGSCSRRSWPDVVLALVAPVEPRSPRTAPARSTVARRPGHPRRATWYSRKPTACLSAINRPPSPSKSARPLPWSSRSSTTPAGESLCPRGHRAPPRRPLGLRP